MKILFGDIIITIYERRYYTYMRDIRAYRRDIIVIIIIHITYIIIGYYYIISWLLSAYIYTLYYASDGHIY